MKTLAMFVLAAMIASPAFTQDKDPKAQDKSESRPAAKAEGRRMGEAVPIVMEKDREVYGAELTFKESTKLADVLKDPKSYSDRKVRVDATIDSVCQKRGCWIVIKDADSKSQVKFQGYSFFVPLDVTGRKVAIEGQVKQKELTEAERRHYAQDAGKSKEEIEKIKGPEKVVMFVADAVEIGPMAPKADAAKPESKPAEKK